MNFFRPQVRAIETAFFLIQRLPEETVWSLSCTNDDLSSSSSSVLNIFAPASEWPRFIQRLKLCYLASEDKTDRFLSYRQGTLVISLVEPE